MKDNRHQEYLAELKRHKWKIVLKANNRNCVHPVEEYLTCGEYKKGTVLIVPQGEINYPVNYSQSRDFWTCPVHLPFYQIEEQKDD